MNTLGPGRIITKVTPFLENFCINPQVENLMLLIDPRRLDPFPAFLFELQKIVVPH